MLSTLRKQIVERLGIEMHDMGFVYMPSRVAAYKLTGNEEEKDSLARAIAACGMLQMIPYLEDGEEKELYLSAVDRIMYSIFERYSTKDTPESNGLLLHTVYNHRVGKGVDECNFWGCYYYMEALARLKKNVEAYW